MKTLKQKLAAHTRRLNLTPILDRDLDLGEINLDDLSGDLLPSSHGHLYRDLQTTWI